MKLAHIQLDEKQHFRYAILPGDPARLETIASFLENAEELAFNREFRSLKGKYKGIEVLAISTGIGGSSTAIAIEELRKIGVEVFLRVGSTGALQQNIQLGDLIIAEGAVRDEGTSKAYINSEYPAVADSTLVALAKTIATEKAYAHHCGIVHSHESFYIDDNAKIEAAYSRCGVLGADMETAALYTVVRLRHGKALSILNNVVTYGQNTENAIGNYVDGASLTKQGEKNEIALALETVYRYHQQLQK